MFIFLEYIVTSNRRVYFFEANWNETQPDQDPLDSSDDLSAAIAFDEEKKSLYFYSQVFDEKHQPVNGSIISMGLTADDRLRTEKIVENIIGAGIIGMAFDSIEHILYWTQVNIVSFTGEIYKVSVDDKSAQPSIVTGVDAAKLPFGITIDECSRHLYWTNVRVSGPSIERIPLDGSSVSEVLIDKDLAGPASIVVDQQMRRLYWRQHLGGDRFSIESAELNGADRRIVYRGSGDLHVSMAVNELQVIWADLKMKAIWGISKNATDGVVPQMMHEFKSEAPMGIIARSQLFSGQK